MFSHEICKVLKNTYLRTAAAESVKYQVYILLSEWCFEEEKEYKIEDNPECFDKLLVLVNDNITKQVTYMRDASIPKLNLATNNVDSFVVLFASFFLL